MQAHGFSRGSGPSLHPALSPQALALGLSDAIWLQDVRSRAGDDAPNRRLLREALSRLHDVASMSLPVAEQEIPRADYSRIASAIVGITREALRYDRGGAQLSTLRMEVIRMTETLLDTLAQVEKERAAPES